MGKAFKLLKNGNPYTEDTTPWHQLLDLSIVDVGGIATVERLCEAHGMPPTFYDDVSELVNDGFIEIIDE